MKGIDRRKSLKVIGLAAVSSLIPTLLVGQKKRKIGVALLGLGSYSTYQLGPALLETKYCELKGIVTGSPEKVSSWQQRYQVKDENVYSYDDMHRIANNNEIDVIYVVTPTGTHADFVKKAASTGKHVWCEKPMAMNSIACQEMIKACNDNKVKLTIGYRMQHEPNTLKVNGYANSRPYGKIRAIEAAAGYHGGGGSGWRFEKEMGGGALYDMGVYTINGIRNALGIEPVSVLKARQYTDRPTLFEEVDEHTTYELQFPNQIKAKGMTSVGNGYNHLRINCENGWYETRPMQTYSGVVGQTSDGKRINAYLPNQQGKQMDDDALALLENREMPINPNEGLKDIRVIEAIIKSARTGKSVPID